MTGEQKVFMDSIGNAAKSYYEEYKVLPSLVTAMAIKESNWGKSKLASVNHNYFGMKWTTKCGTKWVEYNTKEFVNGQYVTVKAKFRSYDTLEEGIKGFYEFITGYKRYSNLIGEKNICIACQKIQVDGWATAPDYAHSLYHDYVEKYRLTAYDVAGAVTIPEDPAEASYIKGRVYITQVNLYIRKTPGGIKKKPYELTVNAKINSHTDQYGNAVLNSGVRVTCIDVAHDGNSTWMLIPSGWICAINSEGKVYIK